MKQIEMNNSTKNHSYAKAKGFRLRFLAHIVGQQRLHVSTSAASHIVVSYGNSIAALTVERVELLKTIAGRRSGELDRHSS